MAYEAAHATTRSMTRPAARPSKACDGARDARTLGRTVTTPDATHGKQAHRPSELAGRSPRALAQGTAGAIFVEYTTLLLMVTIGCAAAITTLGVPLLRLFRFQQLVMIVPFP